jgi:hypothetical protein
MAPVYMHVHLQSSALCGPVADGAALVAALAAGALAPLDVVCALARLLHEAAKQESNHHVGMRVHVLHGDTPAMQHRYEDVQIRGMQEASVCIAGVLSTKCVTL